MYRSIEEKFDNAISGKSDDQLELGLMYEKGRGVPTDPFQAYIWLNIAAQGLSNGRKRKQAIETQERVASKLTAKQKSDASQILMNWKNCLSGKGLGGKTSRTPQFTTGGMGGSKTFGLAGSGRSAYKKGGRKFGLRGNTGHSS